MFWVNKGLALGGTALGGVSSTLTGLFVGPETYLDEVSGQDKYLYKYKDQGNDMSKVALSLQVHGKPESNGASSKSIHSSLDKHYFGPWRALSEGWGDDLYLIDNQDKFHKIEVDKHSTDTKHFWGGKRIVEEEFFWFGPRNFPFDVSSVGDSTGKEPLETVRNILNLLKQQSKDELDQLSKYLDTRTAKQLCDVLDVFWKCWIAEEKFVRSGKTLQDEIDFKLDVVSTELTKVKLEEELPTAEEWKAFAAIFKDMIKFNKLMTFQGQVAKYGLDWAKRQLTSAHGTSKPSKNNAHPNKYDSIEDPAHYWIGVLKGDKLGYDCSTGAVSFKVFFEECSDRDIFARGPEAGYRITHVLKSGSKCCSRDKRTYRISKRGGGNAWWEQHALRPREELEKKFLAQANTKLVIHGIVEDECRNLASNWFDLFGVEKRFCHEVNKMFFGNTVNEKRFCRYEIPNARGYLRAHRFNMFTIPRWTKGNAFWAQCHANGN